MDLEERLSASETSAMDEEDEEEAPERNIFLLLGQTLSGTMGHRRLKDDRPPSPALSYDSMKSDVRSDEDLSDSGEEHFTAPIRIQLERPESPASSCSGESDASTDCPEKPFWMGPRQLSKKPKKKPSNHWAPLEIDEVYAVLGITAQRHPAMNLPFMTEAVRTTLEKLKEHHLIYFKKCLVDCYPQIFESSLLELKIPELTDKILERCDMEGSLKICLIILQRMEQDETAKSLKGMCERNEMRYELKENLKEKYTSIYEGLAEQDSPTLFDDIFTEVKVTLDVNGIINTEHEMRQIGEMVPASRKTPGEVDCRNIFAVNGGYMQHHRFLLTRGRAGIGKSVCLQRFILDWAEEKAHQHFYFVFPIPFRELNPLKSENFSLMQLIHHFFPEMKRLDNICILDKYKVLFIFDGLDECELPLNFWKNETWCSLTSPTKMDMLITNLLRGNIFICAHLWVVARPAAAKRLVANCIHRISEVHGFNDAQKEEYFKKTIKDQALANQIITYLQSERSLYIMCHLPLFCWSASDMLQRAFRSSSGEIPKTFTELFTHFLLIQLKTMAKKYQGREFGEMCEEDREFLIKLGKLALQMLEQDKLILNGEQWKQTGISFNEALVYSGLFTELIKEDYGLYRERLYSFIHLYIQEYLAALYVFLSSKIHNRNVLETQLTSKFSRMFKTSLLDVHKSAVDMTLQWTDGRFDMFLRFLLGLSLGSNEEYLRGILTKVGGGGGKQLQKTAQYIKNKMKENHPENRLKHLAQCLNDIQPPHSTA